MSRFLAVVAATVVMGACAKASTERATPEEANGRQTFDALPAEIQQRIEASVNRHSNDTVLRWCSGGTYDQARCKQHLRGRMGRYSCALNISYENLRERWIASYDEPGRYGMHPDDAFFAFLEDADFCTPKQPGAAMDGAIFLTPSDNWN
ncbi:MAG: hypothetical protein AAGI72_05485 [Pseudomonadota bacterium]